MSPHQLKLVEITVRFLEFMTSIFVIVLTATGATFYYYWTTKSNSKKLKDFWPLAIPSGIVLGIFIFIGLVYWKLISGLAEGVIRVYVEFWFNFVGYILWPALFVSIVSLFTAFVLMTRKS